MKFGETDEVCGSFQRNFFGIVRVEIFHQIGEFVVVGTSVPFRAQNIVRILKVIGTDRGIQGEQVGVDLKLPHTLVLKIDRDHVH